MKEYQHGRSKLSICVITIMSIACVGTFADAREINVDGLPCNDLCQAWMGYSKHVHTGSTIREFEVTVQPRKYDSYVVRSGTKSKLREPETETAAAEDVDPIDEHPAAETLKPGIAEKHVRHKTRQSRSSTPLEAPRPAIPDDPHTLIADDPTLAAPRSPEPFQKAIEPAGTSVSDTGSVGSIARTAPPLPTRAGMTGASNSKGRPVQAIRPAITVTPTSPAVSPPVPPPRVAMIAPVDQTSKPPVGTNVPATPPVAGGAANQASLDPVPAAPLPPPTTVAALPSPVDAGSSLRNDDRPGGNAREGALHSPPTPASNSLSVKIGQISVEPRGTDVHVVVVNVMEHEVKDVDVRCKARDARGLEIAQSSVHIASIAPSDIVFERVLFQTAITTQDNRFVCEVARIAAAADMKP